MYFFGSPSDPNGLWRSLVAHYTGGVGVAGSNPVSPTNRVALIGCGPFLYPHLQRAGLDVNFHGAHPAHGVAVDLEHFG